MELVWTDQPGGRDEEEGADEEEEEEEEAEEEEEEEEEGAAGAAAAAEAAVVGLSYVDWPVTVLKKYRIPVFELVCTVHPAGSGGSDMADERKDEERGEARRRSIF